MTESNEISKEHTNAGVSATCHAVKKDAPEVPFRFYSAQSLFLAFMALRHQYNGRDLMSDDLEKADPIYIACRSIIHSLDKSYRSRKLLMDHIRVLNFYGKIGRAPRDWVPKEISAHGLWYDALEIMSSEWIASGYLVAHYSLNVGGRDRKDHLCRSAFYSSKPDHLVTRAATDLERRISREFAAQMKSSQSIGSFDQAEQHELHS
jgi:hypothetical protein